ncbi:MAG: glycosyltransferase family 4 protein [Nitrospirae bacterium]|nr:MAG: glycosyltransferase family 4 protein [Nitrospirota bacterium]
MSILVVTQNFLPAKGGTITWVVHTYGRYYQQQSVFAVGEHTEAHQIDAALPFTVERLPMQFGNWDPMNLMALRGYVDTTCRILQLTRRYSARQLHVVRVLPEGLVALCVKWIAKVPYLLYAHGEEIQTGLTSRKFRWLIPQIYKGAFAIIANSRNTKCLVEGLGIPERKIHVIHPGVDTAEFCDAEQAGMAVRRRHGIEIGPVLLTVGRLQRRKGQDMVIRTLPTIKKTFPFVRYLIVGTGEEEAFLKQLAREHAVSEHVIFAGRVEDAELKGYYAACDIFVMPNRQIGEDIEGFGIVYLEASAMGKPVIGGKSGGTEDAILDGVTGIRVDGHDVHAVTDALLTLLRDASMRKTMGQQGRHWVEREFSWGKTFENTYQVFARGAENT